MDDKMIFLSFCRPLFCPFGSLHCTSLSARPGLAFEESNRDYAPENLRADQKVFVYNPIEHARPKVSSQTYNNDKLVCL